MIRRGLGRAGRPGLLAAMTPTGGVAGPDTPVPDSMTWRRQQPEQLCRLGADELDTDTEFRTKYHDYLLHNGIK